MSVSVFHIHQHTHLHIHKHTHTKKKKNWREKNFSRKEPEHRKRWLGAGERLLEDMKREGRRRKAIMNPAINSEQPYSPSEICNNSA